MRNSECSLFCILIAIFDFQKSFSSPMASYFIFHTSSLQSSCKHYTYECCFCGWLTLHKLYKMHTYKVHTQVSSQIKLNAIHVIFVRRLSFQLFHILSISTISFIQLIGFLLCCCTVLWNANDNACFLRFYFKWLNQSECEIVCLCRFFSVFFFCWLPCLYLVMGRTLAYTQIHTKAHFIRVHGQLKRF